MPLPGCKRCGRRGSAVAAGAEAVSPQARGARGRLAGARLSCMAPLELLKVQLGLVERRGKEAPVWHKSTVVKLTCL